MLNIQKILIRDFPAYIFYYILKSCRKNNIKIIILMYHSIKPGIKHRLVTDPKNFNLHINWLLKKKWQIIPLSKLITDFHSIRKNTAVVTFDDGYEDNYSSGFHIFKKYNIKPCIFLPTDFIGTNIQFPWFDENARWAVGMSWDQINEMKEDQGVEFGAHTCSHKKLTLINDRAQLKKEIYDSKSILDERLGDTRFFCYPAGHYNVDSVNFVKSAGYSAALSVNAGMVKNIDKARFTLPRIEVSGFDSMEVFKRKIEGAYIPVHKMIQIFKAKYS